MCTVNMKKLRHINTSAKESAAAGRPVEKLLHALTVAHNC